MTRILIYLVFQIAVFSCNNTSKSIPQNTTDKDSNNAGTNQIGQYIVELFEDSKGNLWIGTLSKGIARYDGNSLKYFTVEDGLADNAVIGMLEEADGTLWFGTQNGLTRYDGETYTTYNALDGLPTAAISNMLLDSKGTIWIGTWEGIAIFNGQGFETFEVPIPDVDNPSYLTTMNWVTNLKEDKNGNIWIGRDGYGATKFDGKTFTHYTKKDGLYSNNVTSIHIDNSDSLWIGTRIVERDHPDPAMRKGPGGIQKYDGEKFKTFSSIKAFSTSDNYSFFQDRDNNLWLGVNGIGMYKYDGKTYTLYDIDPETVEKIPSGYMGNLQDRNGTIWIGTNEGLYKIQGPNLINVTQDGPW